MHRLLIACALVAAVLASGVRTSGAAVPASTPDLALLYPPALVLQLPRQLAQEPPITVNNVHFVGADIEPTTAITYTWQIDIPAKGVNPNGTYVVTEFNSVAAAHASVEADYQTQGPFVGPPVHGLQAAQPEGWFRGHYDSDAQHCAMMGEFSWANLRFLAIMFDDKVATDLCAAWVQKALRQAFRQAEQYVWVAARAPNPHLLTAADRNAALWRAESTANGLLHSYQVVYQAWQQQLATNNDMGQVIVALVERGPQENAVLQQAWYLTGAVAYAQAYLIESFDFIAALTTDLPTQHLFVHADYGNALAALQAAEALMPAP